METYQEIGKSAPVHNGMDKATGRQQYVADRKLPHMHYAKLVYSTVAHGDVITVDTIKAQQVPGVKKILTCMNTTDRLYSRARVMVADDDMLQENLFPKRVRFIGDRVAMVVAETRQAAEEAAALIHVTYQELPAVFNVEDAMDKQAVQLHSQGNVYPCDDLVWGERPSTPGLVKVETAICLPRLHHASMEPHGCVADYDPGLQQLTVWTPCQSVFGVRTGIAELLGLPYHKVRVVQETMGGSFGCKQETILEPLTALAALEVKHPVKLIFTREECMHATIQRAGMQWQVTSYVQPDGKILGVEVDCTVDAGAYLTNSADYLFAMREKLTRLYGFGYLSFQGRAVCTNTPVAGSYRSWGSCEIATALEQNIAAAAKQLDMDPVMLRLQNLHMPNATHHLAQGISVGNCRIKDCLQQGQQTFDWQQEVVQCASFNQANSRYKLGVGVAAGAHINGFFPDAQEHATVGMRMNEDGTVDANLCLHDHGCGTITAFQKIIGEVLGIPTSHISIQNPDTSKNYYDYGCYGSRTTYVIGRATQNCAEQLLQQIKGQAAVFLDASQDALTAENGFVFVKNQPQRRLSFGQIVRKAQVETQQELFATEQYMAASNPTSSGVHFAKVRVDCYTGLIQVVKYLAVHDLGKAINPAMCATQIGGAAQQGIGAVLSEEVTYDLTTGQPRCHNLNKYHLINMPDMPPVETLLVEEGGDQGPFGAKSIGEAALVPAAASVLNAVENALSIHIPALPITPVRLLALLEEKGGMC